MPISDEIQLPLTLAKLRLLVSENMIDQELNLTKLQNIWKEHPKSAALFKSDKSDGTLLVAKFKDYAFYFQFDKLTNRMWVQTENVGLCAHPMQEQNILQCFRNNEVILHSNFIQALDDLIERHQRIQQNSFNANTLSDFIHSPQQSISAFDKERVYIIHNKNNPDLFELNWHENGRMQSAKLFFNKENKCFHSERIDKLAQAVEKKKLVCDAQFPEVLDNLLNREKTSSLSLGN